MQNDEPLQWLRNKWTRRDDHSSDFLHYLINGQDVPNCIDGEPFLSNQGNNWITLEWPKPNYNEGAPILAYRVECCKYNDDEKDSHWTEVGISLHNSLDIFNLKSNESYMFRVTPRNRYGYGQSVTTFNPIKINETIEFPEFEKILPGHMIVLQFSPLKLQCQLRNPNESEVFWYKDSSKISEDDHITFNYHEGRCEMIINETNENDSGRYICEVVNNRGKACTYTTILIVTDPALVEAEKKLNSEEIDKAPEFSMRLKDRTVQMTYPVRLSCQVVGYPEPVVMWFKDGHLIQGDNTHVIYKEANNFHTLEISRSMLEDSGEYEISASNHKGSVSCKCTLTVDKGVKAYTCPSFKEQLNAVYTAKEMTQLSMCAVIEGYPSVDISWCRDGIRLMPNRGLTMTNNHDGVVVLTIAYVSKKDSGVYTCIATNAVGTCESSTKLEIIPTDESKSPDESASIDQSVRPYSKEPIFITKPQTYVATEGEEVIIKCEVIGDPEPNVTWLRDRLKPEYYHDSNELKFRNIGQGQHTIEIDSAKLQHTGAYSIIASNSHGEIKAIMSLQVLAKAVAEDNQESPLKGQRLIHSSRVEKFPVIKKSSTDISCYDGDSVVLKYELQDASSPDLNITWKKNGKLLRMHDGIQTELIDNIARLTINHVYPDDEGQYTCIVSNNLGSASASSYITVNVPEDKENMVNKHLNKPLNSYSRNGVQRSTTAKSSSPSYPRENGSQPSESVHRRPSSAPKFYSVPHSRVVEEGETVKFQCAIAGQPIPQIIWDKDGLPIKDNNKISFQEYEDIRILNISSVSKEDEGLYRIIIENDFGRTEATARLEVIGRSNLKCNLSSVNIEEIDEYPPTKKFVNIGGKCTLSCDQNSTPTTKITWFKDGFPISEQSDRINSIDGTVASLIINNLKTNDSGTYTCVSENEFAKTICRVELMVVNHFKNDEITMKPPIFLKGLPDDVVAVEGQPFEFTVSVQGNWPIFVTWFKEGKKIPDCNDFKYMQYSKEKFSLRIADAFTNDSGLYICKAFNCYGESTTRSYCSVQSEFENNNSGIDSIAEIPKTSAMELKDKNGTSQNFETLKLNSNGCVKTSSPKVDNVLAARLIEGPKDVTVLRGASVVLKASFIGIPEPSVKWLKAGTQVFSDGRISLKSSNGVSSLEIKDITADDSGKYIIQVCNSYGSDCHFSSLAVEGSPDAPTGQPNVLTNNTSAIVTWCSPAYDGRCMVTGYTIEVRLYNELIWNTVTENCHSLSHTIHGLTPGESYVFRIKAQNIHGLSGPSMESSPVHILKGDLKQIPLQDGDKFAEEYEILDELGRGRYGVVHKIRNIEKGSEYAAKIIRCIKAKDKEAARQEIEIMNMLRHPKLLHLTAAFENSREIILVTEYITGGELFERVVADDFTLTERDCILFMRQICEGVAFIHDKNVVHLDLKPENVMCVSRKSHEIKLIDFGLAQKITPGTPIRVMFGTPEFIPPEIINYEPIGTQSDMWSLGVICYVLLTGLSPFMGENDCETFANITRADYDFEDEAFDAISEDAKDFISQLLIKKKEKRLTATQCLDHKWLAQEDQTMNCVKLPTDKLKKFIIRRKWQKTGNAIRALGRMATLSAASRRNSNGSSVTLTVPKVNIFTSEMPNLEEENSKTIDDSTVRVDGAVTAIVENDKDKPDLLMDACDNKKSNSPISNDSTNSYTNQSELITNTGDNNASSSSVTAKIKEGQKVIVPSSAPQRVAVVSNQSDKSSLAGKIKTSERLKLFEDLSVTKGNTGKKENSTVTYVPTASKSNFQKAKAFWNQK